MTTLNVSARRTNTYPAFAVLTLREIRNLLAIAEREADLRPVGYDRGDTFVVVNGDAHPGEDGRVHLALRTAGYSDGDFTLWSQHRITRGPATVRSGTLDEVIDSFSAESNR